MPTSLPIALKLTEGQAHDGKRAANMLGGIGEGQIPIADRAYDPDSVRSDLVARGAWANVRPMPDRKRRPAFSAFLCRYRNHAERLLNKIKHFRSIATLDDKDPPAGVLLASVRIRIRTL